MRRLLLLGMLILSGGAAAQDAAPPAGKGRLVFYRTGGMQYGWRGCPIFEARAEGAIQVAGLGGGRYAVVDADPGAHRFAASKKLKHPVQVDLAASETIYVRCQFSGFPGGPKLLASHRAEFERHAEGLEPAQ